ncbi:hypothetical protein K4K48_003450 [Colletotrichum sp. SAR 10_66]|nr:hypothetical protein K4K48_003450 [Colletotrichum sp. SAR 10_66]
MPSRNTVTVGKVSTLHLHGKGANSYCCKNTQSADFPTFRGACFSPQNARDREDASQSCTGGSVYCCD